MNEQMNIDKLVKKQENIIKTESGVILDFNVFELPTAVAYSIGQNGKEHLAVHQPKSLVLSICDNETLEKFKKI